MGGTPFFHAHAGQFNFDRIVNPKYKCEARRSQPRRIRPRRGSIPTRCSSPKVGRWASRTRTSFENEVTPSHSGFPRRQRSASRRELQAPTRAGTGQFTFKQWPEGQSVSRSQREVQLGPGRAREQRTGKDRGVTFRILPDNYGPGERAGGQVRSPFEEPEPAGRQKGSRQWQVLPPPQLRAARTGIPYALLLNSRRRRRDDLRGSAGARVRRPDQGTIVRRVRRLVTPMRPVYFMAWQQRLFESQHIYSYNPAKAKCSARLGRLADGVGRDRTKNAAKRSVAREHHQLGFDGIEQLVLAQVKCRRRAGQPQRRGIPGRLQGLTTRHPERRELSTTTWIRSR